MKENTEEEIEIARVYKRFYAALQVRYASFSLGFFSNSEQHYVILPRSDA
jgi:hypothetical protein